MSDKLARKIVFKFALTSVSAQFPSILIYSLFFKFSCVRSVLLCCKVSLCLRISQMMFLSRILLWVETSASNLMIRILIASVILIRWS